jgi:hypothetical protein
VGEITSKDANRVDSTDKSRFEGGLSGGERGAENNKSGREEEEWGGGVRVGCPLAAWIHLTLRTFSPGPGDKAGQGTSTDNGLGFEGYLRWPWRYRHIISNCSYNRLPLTRRATAIDSGGIPYTLPPVVVKRVRSG